MPWLVSEDDVNDNKNGKDGDRCRLAAGRASGGELIRSDVPQHRSAAHHLAVVNGSTRMPLRTNATITATPTRKKTA